MDRSELIEKGKQTDKNTNKQKNILAIRHTQIEHILPQIYNASHATFPIQINALTV